MKKTNLLALILVVCSITFSAHAVELSYRAYDYGVHSSDIDLQYELTGTTYKVQAQAKGVGILSALAKDETFFYSIGYIDGEKYSPELLTYKRTDGSKEEFLGTDFKKEENFQDYFSTVLSIATMRKMDSKVIKVRDAERQFVARLEYMGPVAPNPKIKMKTDPCREWEHYILTIESLEGPATGWFFKNFDNGKSPKMNLYFAQIPDVLELVLVNAEMDKISLQLAAVIPDKKPASIWEGYLKIHGVPAEQEKDDNKNSSKNFNLKAWLHKFWF